jgi:hypothetical protein
VLAEVDRQIGMPSPATVTLTTARQISPGRRIFEGMIVGPMGHLAPALIARANADPADNTPWRLFDRGHSGCVGGGLNFCLERDMRPIGPNLQAVLAAMVMVVTIAALVFWILGVGSRLG